MSTNQLITVKVIHNHHDGTKMRMAGTEYETTIRRARELKGLGIVDADVEAIQPIGGQKITATDKVPADTEKAPESPDKVAENDLTDEELNKIFGQEEPGEKDSKSGSTDKRKK